MKLKFSRKVPFTPEFNDNKKLPEVDQTKATLTVLNLAELAYVGEVIAKLGITKENAGEVSLKSNVLKEMAVDMTAILESHVTITNLEDESGPVSIKDIATLAPYMGLSLELLIELATISAPGEGDTKNSKTPSV